MDIIRAKEILEKKKKEKEEEKEALESLKEALEKEKQQKEEAEQKAKKEELEKEKKRYPEFAGELFQKCWQCKKTINMSQGQMLNKNSKIVIVKECPGCGSYCVAVIPTTGKASSKHDHFLPLVDLS